jgi:hypothetical protein
MLAQIVTHRMFALLLCGFALTLGSSGCAFGPRMLEQTHGRYNEAVRCVYEEQLLRNIVHMRYNESPWELNVSAIAAQYELTAQAEARPFFIAPNPSNANVVFKTFTSILPDALVSGANRPTISLDPADDSEAIRQFLTPIPADTLLFLARTSWPPDTVLRLWVERINGVPNAVETSGPPRPVVPDFARFQRIAELIQIAQDRELMRIRSDERFTQIGGPLPASAITAAALIDAAKDGLEYRSHSDGQQWVLVRPERRSIMEVTHGAENAPELLELEHILNLVPGQPQYDLVIKSAPDADPLLFPVPPKTTMDIMLRSTAQVYFYMASGVEVPAEHLNCGLVPLAVDSEGHAFDSRQVTRGLFEVHTAKGLKPPSNAYVAIKYRGYWYYIDDRDQDSKMTLALMLGLTRLDFGKPLSAHVGPVLTLPAGR